MISIIMVLSKWGIIRITNTYRVRLATRIMFDRDDYQKENHLVQLFFMLLSNIKTFVLQVRIHRNALL